MVNVFELAQLTKELVTSSPEGCLSVSAPFKLTERGGDRLASQFAAGAELEVTSPLSCEATAANPCGAARKHRSARRSLARPGVGCVVQLCSPEARARAVHAGSCSPTSALRTWPPTRGRPERRTGSAERGACGRGERFLATGER